MAIPEGQFVPALEVTRGPMVESVHSASIAVADATGNVRARLGGIDHPIFLRSSAKPFQAMAVVESGAMEKFGLEARELAIMAGSHSSEPVHVETVRGILAKLGLDVTALKCGTHTPFNHDIAREYEVSGRPLTALEHNCSGKHAGMLAAALAGGHDISRYLNPAHPVQQRIMGVVTDLTGRMRERIIVSVDGCGAPTLGVTLAEAARAFARMVAPAALAPVHAEAAARVVEAMRAHPGMVAGEGMMDTDLTGWPRHSLISKRGAEGVQCLGYVRDGTGMGVAAKVADGDNYRGRVAMLVGILSQLDLLSLEESSRLAESGVLVIRNNAGRPVGTVRPAFKLQPA